MGIFDNNNTSEIEQMMEQLHQIIAEVRKHKLNLSDLYEKMTALKDAEGHAVDLMGKMEKQLSNMEGKLEVMLSRGDVNVTTVSGDVNDSEITGGNRSKK